MAQTPRKALAPMGHGDIQRSMPAAAQMAKLRLNPVYIIEDALVTLGNFSANTSCYVDLPVGKYTYRQLQIAIWAPANIPSVTQPRDGKELVNSANITTYVDSIILEINGKNEWEMTAEEIRRWNDYQNLSMTEGMLRIPFGAPGQFFEDSAEDAYQLGTSNLTSLRLRIRTKPTWVAGMLPIVTTEYARVRRPLTYLQRTVRHSATNPSIGKFMLNDLPVGKDFSGWWIQSANIARVKFIVDDDIVLDVDNFQMRGIHEAFGKDVLALGAGVVFDSWRDMDAIGLDSVSDSVAERRRGAEVKIELTMLAAAQVMTIVVFQCGLWDQN